MRFKLIVLLKLSRMSKKNFIKRVSNIKHPFILIVISFFLLFTALGISGSSIGIAGPKPSETLSLERIGKPRAIRSDEWLVSTQLTISQAQNNYKIINDNIGGGQNVSVALDVPYKEWSIFLKPQNLFFFFLPFNNAFAAKWWFGISLLLTSSYLLGFKLLKDKRSDAKSLSAMLSIITSFAPMIIWWYQTNFSTPLVLAYPMVLSILYIQLINKKELGHNNSSLKRGLLYGVTTGYLASCWALLMYPPFQIAIAIVFGAFLTGYTIQVLTSLKLDLKKALLIYLKKLWPFILGGALGLLAILVFVKTRSNVISAIQNTVYPGARDTHAGGLGLRSLTTGAFNYTAQWYSRSLSLPLLGGELANQSEFSSFGPWWIFTLILMPILIIQGIGLKGKRLSWAINWQALSLMSVSILILFRMFIPWGNPLYSPFLLKLVTNNRLKIAFIPIIFFTLIVWAQAKGEDTKGYRLKDLINFKRLSLIRLYTTLLFSVFVAASGIWLAKTGPGIILRPKIEILFISLFCGLALYLVLIKKLRASLLLISIFTVASSMAINPLQRGLGPFSPSNIDLHQATTELKKYTSKEDLFIENSDITKENTTEILDQKSLTGIYTYPDLGLWKESGADRFIYNRYAHVTAVINTANPHSKVELFLNNPDSFTIKSGACSLKNQLWGTKRVTKVISYSKLNSECLKYLSKVGFNNSELFIYQIQ
jgi:hypothetical protein